MNQERLETAIATLQNEDAKLAARRIAEIVPGYSVFWNADPSDDPKIEFYDGLGTTIEIYGHPI